MTTIELSSFYSAVIWPIRFYADSKDRNKLVYHIAFRKGLYVWLTVDIGIDAASWLEVLILNYAPEAYRYPYKPSLWRLKAFREDRAYTAEDFEPTGLGEQLGVKGKTGPVERFVHCGQPVRDSLKERPEFVAAVDVFEKQTELERKVDALTDKVNILLSAVDAGNAIKDRKLDDMIRKANPVLLMNHDPDRVRPLNNPFSGLKFGLSAEEANKAAKRLSESFRPIAEGMAKTVRMAEGLSNPLVGEAVKKAAANGAFAKGGVIRKPVERKQQDEDIESVSEPANLRDERYGSIGRSVIVSANSFAHELVQFHVSECTIKFPLWLDLFSRVKQLVEQEANVCLLPAQREKLLGALSGKDYKALSAVYAAFRVFESVTIDSRSLGVELVGKPKDSAVCITRFYVPFGSGSSYVYGGLEAATADGAAGGNYKVIKYDHKRLSDHIKEVRTLYLDSIGVFVEDWLLGMCKPYVGYIVCMSKHIYLFNHDETLLSTLSINDCLKEAETADRARLQAEVLGQVKAELGKIKGVRDSQIEALLGRAGAWIKQFKRPVCQINDSTIILYDGEGKEPYVILK